MRGVAPLFAPEVHGRIPRVLLWGQNGRLRVRQEQGPEELLGRDRGAAGVGVQQGEARREVLERLVHHCPDRPKWMVLGNPLHRLNVAPHVPLLSVLSAHPTPPLRDQILETQYTRT